MARWILTVALALGAGAACNKNVDQPVAREAPATPAASAAAPMKADVAGEHVHSVACGCSLGKACSNMIEVDGEYVPLTGEIGLDAMAFCGQEGLKAKVAGALVDGSFVATSFELVK